MPSYGGSLALRHGPPEIYSYTALSILTLYISLYSYTSLYTLYNLYTTHTHTPLPWRQGAEDLGSAGIVCRDQAWEVGLCDL